MKFDWIKDQLDLNGFVLVRSAISVETCRELAQCLDPFLNAQVSAAGLRHVLMKVPGVLEIASGSTFRQLACHALRSKAWPVKSICFDKRSDANWLVPWHQDLSIAVRDRHPRPDFRNWSLKEGVHYVQPPVEILQTMVTLRVYLDESGPESGSLRVLTGSHRFGRLSQSKIDQIAATAEEYVCLANRGDVFLMSPLVLHASSKATQPVHRRILHIEFASQKLPDPLKWCFESSDFK